MMLLVQIFPWALSLLLVAVGWRYHRQQRRDAAERARTEAAHARTTLTLTRMSQAIESASDAIGIGDMEGTSLHHNRAHLALFGYTVEELNNIPDGGALFADRIVAAAIHAAIRGGYSWAGETEVRTKDGRIVPCFVRADVIRDEQGEPAGIFGVFTDITERRRVQLLVDEQRQRLEITLQSIGDAVITTDAEGRVVLFNPIAEQFTGLTAAQAAGQPLGEVLRLTDERTRAPRPSAAAELLRENRDARAADAYVLTGKDGAERLVAENAALIRTAGGATAGVVLALRDITRERKRADDAARAGKLESLGMLAGGIAHDFGNLLTAMVGHIAVAQRAPGLPETVAQRLVELDRTVWRAKDVTQQLVTFAKGGAPRKKRLALPALVREAAAYAAANSTVQARYVFAPNLHAVEADEAQLVQVVSNLAVNARQAMPDGGILLVTAENYDPDRDSQTPLRSGRWVRLSVADTGTGIAPENLAKIFDPFFTTKAKGTGLGLATCYSIVKRHGGQFRVESQLGRGTTFHLLLPAAPDESTASAAPFAASSPSTVPFPTAARRKSLGRILLMDDERPVREAVALMLGLLDYDVTEAAHGAEALATYTAAHAQGRAFDAVLLDLRVPGGLGGAQIVQQLRALDPHLRAIAASGYHDDPVMADCAAHGFSAALAKPFKMSELETLLRELLAR